jgi:tetratricopeptide (TPR) repeat protein
MEWACALFALPGYAAQTKSTSYRYFEKIDKSSIDFGKYQSFQAEAHFSMGRYKDAVKNCDAASEIFKKNKNKELFYYSEFRKIDSLRCWGKNKKAFKYQKFIRSQLINDKGLKARVKSDLLSKINLQEILLLREEYVKAEILLRKSKARLIQEDIKAKLKDIVDKAKHGNWYDLQQCHLWANRVGIRFKEIYDGPLQPLEDREGYKKLGHVIAEMMSIRDALTKKNLEIDEAEFRKYLDTAQLIQSYSELWKLRQSLKKHFRVKITEKIFWLFPFFFCQYTIPMRIKKVISENRTK